MPTELLALTDKPFLLIGVLLVGVVIGMAAERFLSRMRRQAWRRETADGGRSAMPQVRSSPRGHGSRIRHAGIGYHEVVSGQTTPSELRRLVERLVEKPTPAAE